MKTTLDPDSLIRHAKSAAVAQGIPLRDLVSEALVEKLRNQEREEKPWLKSIGKLRSLRKESVKISRTIEQAFGQVELQNWREN